MVEPIESAIRRISLKMAAVKRHSEYGICPNCREVFTRQQVADVIKNNPYKALFAPWRHEACGWECSEWHPIPIMVRWEGGEPIVR